jgi:hypothetical protein
MKIKQETTMAPVKLKCEVVGCTKETQEGELGTVTDLLEINHSQVYIVFRKPNKPKHPELTMMGDAVEDMDYDRFVFQFSQYRKLLGLSGDAPSHLPRQGDL